MANNDWLQISQQLHDELNEMKRDALVPYAIATDDSDPKSKMPEICTNNC